jgi:hypothetical protein
LMLVIDHGGSRPVIQNFSGISAFSQYFSLTHVG